MIQIPLEAIPAQEFSILLDNQPCTISLYQRGALMYMDLHVGDAVIFRGNVCNNLSSILQSPTRAFKGSLHFADTRGDTPPQWEGLNSRYVLVYVAEGEM